MAVFICAGAAASVVYWGFQLTTPPASPSTAALTAPGNVPHDATASVARALGHTATAAVQVSATGSPFKLMGVIASASGQGSALIATDGQAPKAYRVGQAVQDGLILTALTPRQAILKSASQQLQLDLPGVE